MDNFPPHLFNPDVNCVEEIFFSFRFLVYEDGWCSLVWDNGDIHSFPSRESACEFLYSHFGLSVDDHFQYVDDYIF